MAAVRARPEALYATRVTEPACWSLDEPTAHLDVRAEAALYDEFLDITQGLTTILVSHRYSTVRRADRICVVEHGALVEEGSHDELLAMRRDYASSSCSGFRFRVLSSLRPMGRAIWLLVGAAFQVVTPPPGWHWSLAMVVYLQGLRIGLGLKLLVNSSLGRRSPRKRCWRRASSSADRRRWPVPGNLELEAAHICGGAHRRLSR